MKKIIADWSLGNKFREIKVYTYNYNQESITTYAKSTDLNEIEFSKNISHINNSEPTIIYKKVRLD